MEIANLFSGEWGRRTGARGFRIREAQIGARVGAELIGGSVYEVDPGKKLWPYHIHHVNEEWLIVPDSGKVDIVTAKGEQMLLARRGERVG